MRNNRLNRIQEEVDDRCLVHSDSGRDSGFGSSYAIWDMFSFDYGCWMMLTEISITDWPFFFGSYCPFAFENVRIMR